MKIIGLTGGIACGKSTIASLLKSMGASIVDADAINAQLTAPGGEALPLIHEAFGDFVFYPDGTLNLMVDEKAPFEAFVYLADLAKVNREGRFVISTKAAAPQN